MLGMSFISFLFLTVIAAAVAAVYHYGLRYRFLEGFDAFFGKLVVGWLGAWLGSPVLGHWFWKVENVYLLPAILGAIAAIHLNMLGGKALARLTGLRSAVPAGEVKPTKTAAAA